MINKENVGRIFTDSDGSFWKLESYCEYPTATLVKVGTEVRRGGAVNSLNLKDFKLAEATTHNMVEAVLKQVESKT